jgi:hypothetical protein
MLVEPTQDRAFRTSLNDLLKLRAEKRKQKWDFESRRAKAEPGGRKRAEAERRAAVKAGSEELHRDNGDLGEGKGRPLLRRHCQPAICPASPLPVKKKRMGTSTSRLIFLNRLRRGG